ncbi:MAG: polysaccharide biosynthesis C-terminal domain-containing protein, partial [Bacillota bacterium]
VVCGELCGLGLMIYIYLTRRASWQGVVPGTTGPLWSGARRLLGLGVPVTLARVVATAIMSVEAMLIPHCLQAGGLSTGAATAAYGQLAGIAESLLFTPGVITIALATALLPAISEAAAAGHWPALSQRAAEAVRLTIIISVPAAVFFLMLPHELCGVLFGYPAAGEALQILAISGPFLYLQQTFTGMLQGLGRADLPFRNLLLASAVKLAGIGLLTPVLHIRGAAIAVSGSLLLNSLLNYHSLKKLLSWPTPLLRQGQKPLLAGLAAATAIYLLKGLSWPLFASSPALALTVEILGGSLVYLLVLLLTGGLTPGELARYMSVIRRR